MASEIWRGEIAAIVRRFQIQAMSDLTEKIQRRAGGPVQVNHFEEIGIQPGKPGSGSGGLAGADFAGEKTARRDDR